MMKTTATADLELNEELTNLKVLDVGADTYGEILRFDLKEIDAGMIENAVLRDAIQQATKDTAMHAVHQSHSSYSKYGSNLWL